MDKATALQFLNDLEKEISKKHTEIYQEQRKHILQTYEVPGIGKLADLLERSDKLPEDIRKTLEEFAGVPPETFLSISNWAKYILSLELSKYNRKAGFDLGAVDRVRKAVKELF